LEELNRLSEGEKVKVQGEIVAGEQKVTFEEKKVRKAKARTGQ
jgi:hypothetical protein